MEPYKMVKVVAVSGFFDPLHVGHIEYFKMAKGLGDRLIVVLNNDEQLLLKRGKSGFMNQSERKKVIESIGFVDEVFISVDKDRSICESLRVLSPDVFANGGDRFADEIPESKVCRELGIEMVDGLGEKVKSSREFYNKDGNNGMEVDNADREGVR
jgi:cytidyltransferase-like protein